jgi:hypothetical protein
MFWMILLPAGYTLPDLVNRHIQAVLEVDFSASSSSANATTLPVVW